MRSTAALEARHPYIAARLLYTTDCIPASQAAGMCARDREFIAECELTGRDELEEARRIVRDVWTPELVRFLQDLKRAGSARERADYLREAATRVLSRGAAYGS